MEPDRGDSFLSNFEPNRILFGSKSIGKLSPRSYPIQFERKWNYSFLSVDGGVIAYTFSFTKSTSHIPKDSSLLYILDGSTRGSCVSAVTLQK